jgi:hypothetical protein
MQIDGLDVLPGAHISASGEVALNRSLPMSILPFPRRPAANLPVESYDQSDRSAQPPVQLRKLSALEQMYAYWGADRA